MVGLESASQSACLELSQGYLAGGRIIDGNGVFNGPYSNLLCDCLPLQYYDLHQSLSNAG